VRVLVIEDDEEMAEAIAFGLRQGGMAVDVALDGPAGLVRVRVNDYDVIVLDRDLPGMHGDELCTTLVEEESRPRTDAYRGGDGGGCGRRPRAGRRRLSAQAV
jgi:DNA-binding response OmpR family regulator